MQDNDDIEIKKLDPKNPKRGEIYLTDLGTNVGHEFNGYHPAIIIQNDEGNRYGDTTIVLPITGMDDSVKFDHKIHFKITNYDLETKVDQGLDKSPSKVKLADITTIDQSRLKAKVGKLKKLIMIRIDKKLKKILDFQE